MSSNATGTGDGLVFACFLDLMPYLMPSLAAEHWASRKGFRQVTGCAISMYSNQPFAPEAKAGPNLILWGSRRRFCSSTGLQMRSCFSSISPTGTGKRFFPQRHHRANSRSSIRELRRLE